MVWILGSSYIQHGEQRARTTLGSNLGANAHVEWFGLGGMRWHSLVPHFNSLARQRGSPDALLLHCGGNDLGVIRSVELVAAMKQDLQALYERFPNMILILSFLTQRRLWSSANPKGIEHSRRWVNSHVSAFISRLQGIVIPHPDIRFNRPELFLRDEVHLSPLGNDIFLKDLAECLRALFP